MDKDIILWIFGAYLTLLIPVIGVLFKLSRENEKRISDNRDSIVREMSDKNGIRVNETNERFAAVWEALNARFSEWGQRIVKIETTLEMLGMKAAKILHSPHHTPRFDELLEKFSRDDLSSREIAELLSELSSFENDPDTGTGDKLSAVALALQIRTRYHLPLKLPEPERPPPP